MATPTTLEPPSSPPPGGVNIIDSGPPKPPPKPTSTIRVSQMPLNTEAPTPEPRRGSAMDQMREDLAKKFNKAPEPPAKPAVTKPTVPKAKQPPAPTPEPEAEPSNEEPSTETPNVPESTTDPEKPKATTEEPKPTTTEPAKDKKVNPWKVVDEYKQRLTKAEQEAVELKKQLVPEAERKAITERVQQIEARNKELEDEIRYVNYQKSEDFRKNYQKPYEDAFQRAMTDLKDVTLKDPNTGADRQMTGEDLAQFAFMSLVQAKQAAMQVSPDFADDIMAARKEVRTLWDKRQQALEEAKVTGAKRDEERTQKFQQEQAEISRLLQGTWTKVNTAALEDPENGPYFKPREGDADWNQRLAKGYELVDRAYHENPSRPGLSAEERASIIKRHAAVRNRAASWGAVKHENSKLKSEIAELKAELAKYSEVEPETTGTEGPGQPAAPMTAMEEAKAKLRKLAHM